MPRFIPAPDTAFPVPPPIPIYNDPQYTYNEPCLCYNGGWDLICLFGVPHRKIGGRTGKKPGRQYPEPEMVDLLFKTCIVCVNDEVVDLDSNPEFCEERKYRFLKDSDIEVRATDLTVNVKKDPEISSELEEVSHPTEEHISASKDVIKVESKKTSMSSSLKNLRASVSSSLKLSHPRKIVIKSSSIKIKKKD